MGTEIFFGKSEIKLDTFVNKRPDGQITARRREQIPLVSRTRCSALRAAPQSRDLYCHLLPCEMDPGSAAHRCALRWSPPLRGMIRILLEFARDQMVQRQQAGAPRDQHKKTSRPHSMGRPGAG